jgi:hypothetical protein
MKRALLPILLTFPLIHIGGCSSEDQPFQVPGGAGTGSPGVAGTAAGGSDGTAGTGTGTAGTGTGTAGTGTAGTGTGTAGSGTGTSGSGGMSMGGSGTGGASGGSGGVSVGGGGTGTGGGSGGSGGSGGAAPTPVSVGKLDGMLIMTPCGDTPTGDDCASSGWIYEGKNTPCVGGRLDSDAGDKTILDFPVTGGEKGKRYLATMHFYGMMEPKNYGNSVVREAGTQRPNSSANPSTPEGFATAEGGVSVAVTDYNNYEIHSFDDTGKEIKQYFINSDTQQGHYTFAVNYERPIEVVSGGKVHVRVYDNNCRMIKNCLGGPPCSDQKARRIDVSGAMPQPTALMQPGMGKPAEHSGQWFFIDVKGIVAKP